MWLRFLGWLMPGLRIKRWLLVFALAVACGAAGLSLITRTPLLANLEALLQKVASGPGGGLGPAAAAIVLLVAGLGLATWAILRLADSVADAFWPGRSHQLKEAILRRRQLERGPRVVAIGGGTGLPVLLRGLKQYSANLTALVTVADDGGSSGRLRAELGILPPGDLRNCLIALADIEPLMERLLQHRFQNRSQLAGHSFGNLLIAAMSEITGDFFRSLGLVSQVLAVRGRVLPITLAHVRLAAELADGRQVTGESAITNARAGPVRRVWLEPEDVAPLPEALTALAEADVIVIGPGSLYTSILPNLLVNGVADAIRSSGALKIYVCNVMTQPGETDGYDVARHVQALFEHAGPGLFDRVLVNTGPVAALVRERYAEEGAEPVAIDKRALKATGLRVIGRRLVTDSPVVRHDPELLGQAVMAEVFNNAGAWPSVQKPKSGALGRERQPSDKCLEEGK
ncbi:MAG: gluconeogenesis factor YvcK family protein [Bacillota bacterium]